MAPRKKSKPGSSSSFHTKKSNHNNNNSNQCSQPSKFGIQHFFERHTQNAAASAASNPSQIPPPPNASTSDPPPPNHSQTTPSPPVTIPAVPTIAAGADCGAIVAVAAGKDNDDRLDASPEVYSKSVSVKRFKFSPGMLIKQSQDDGGEEVTWRISPVNERLQAVSKRLPDVIRVLADASKMKASSFRPCSMKESSPSSMEKLEKWLSSPALKPPERSLALLKRAGSREGGLDQEAEVRTSNSGGNIVNNGGVPMQGSPFQTPPSISYCPDEPANATTKEGLDGLSSRTHRKALLELLDQVEDVISVEGSVDNNSETHTFKAKDTKPICKPCDSKSPMTAPMVSCCSSNLNFLVLEVSEKQRTADQSCDQHPIKVLRLLNEQSGRECSLYLYDAWFYSVVEPGDTINVIGEFDDQGKCVVDNDNNLLIVHPDLLVSGTRVASSFSCPRRSVLDERLKCKEHSTAALIGTILHQIFQAGLIREHPTKEHLEEYARVVLRKNVESMYACGVNDNDVHTTLVEAIPKILNWLKCFKDSQECKAPAVDFGSMYEQENLSITEVMDIEEMAWAPNYGLKGVIDASIQAKMQSHTNKTTEKMMPLEFKTGKATSGQSFMEHRAQVVLYTLLMSERYLKHIDSGLLYYLHTDQTQGISVQRSDIVGLIMRRNELANDIRKASTTQQLPPMLQNLSVCKGCRHLNICTIYHKAHGGHSDSSGLGMLFDSHVEHLSRAHYDFLRHWDRLIDLEAKETKIVKKDLWPSHSQNELSTNSLSSLILDISDKSLPYNKSPKNGRFIYHFLRQDLPRHDHDTLNRDSVKGVPSWMSNQDCALKSGDYVVLSSEAGHFALASGIIADINRLHVSVSFSRRLRLPGGRPASETGDLLRQLWRIDKDEFKTSYAVMRFNLIQLFVQSSQSSHLRKMIVDLEPPRFDRGIVFSQDPAVSYIRSEKSLNNDQRRAIHKILTAKDYVLILGMPGTGKTSTMVHAVKALLMRGVSILLTSYTNSAVDNLLIKLNSQGIDFVRIGRHEAVHEEIRDHCFSGADRCTVEDIKVRLEKVKVVAVTCLGITHPLLAKKRFDICIMDEAGQTTLPVSLGPLMFASTFVLVGDHYQLPPLVQSAEARENGMGISLFRRLSEAHPEAISALQSQYRMCAGIMELSNALIYGNRLRCGSSEIANAKLNFRNTNCTMPWLNEVLDANRSVVLINTDVLPALEVKEHQTVNNPTEAYIVSEITNELLKRGIVQEEIGIITPYNSQANLIRRLVGGTNVEAHTIDKYQGRDKDCILVSFVRSTENPRSFSSSLLGDWHRINVALTRAKKKLIMVGSSGTLSKVPLLKLLIDKVEEQHGLLSISRKDFNHLGELKRCSLLH